MNIASLRFAGIYVVQKVVTDDKVHRVQETYTSQDDAVIESTLSSMLKIRPPEGGHPVGELFHHRMREQLIVDKSFNLIQAMFGAMPEVMRVRDFCKLAPKLNQDPPRKTYIKGNAMDSLHSFSPKGLELLPKGRFHSKHYFDENIFITDDEQGDHATRMTALVEEFREQEAVLADAYRKKRKLDPAIPLDELLDELYEDDDFAGESALVHEVIQEKMKALYQDSVSATMHVTVSQVPEQPPEASYRITPHTRD